MTRDGTNKPRGQRTKQAPAIASPIKTPVHEMPGVRFLAEHFDARAQAALLASIQDVLEHAPYFRPTMPRTGKPFSVAMSNCGDLGWVSDKDRGYRYQATHPDTGRPWPKMPQVLTELWRYVSGYPGPAEACLINFYDSARNETCKMGSHVDRDEADFSAPVVSVSLGDDAVFHVGGPQRTDPKSRVTLRSGDVLLFGGPARLCHHGIDRVLPGTSLLLPQGGRINLTMRRVTPWAGGDG
jgi:DNA oxidative demethylase